MKGRILITGANGFIGQAVCRLLKTAGHPVLTLTRQVSASNASEAIYTQADFVGVDKTLSNVAPLHAVIHLAARVHALHDKVPASLAAFRQTNVAGALRVAQAAARAGAQRFVFVSSIKALGEVEPGRPWREDDPPLPIDPYGVSKREAEIALTALGREIGMEIVIARPPLVYGPGVRANFLRLMRAIVRGFPLPIAAVHAQRSFIYLDNLTDALVACVASPAAAGQVFHFSDGADLSVAELARALGRALAISARLWRAPAPLLYWLDRITGHRMQIDKLIQPARLDIMQARTVLNWSPPYSVNEGLLQTAAWYKNTHQNG